MRYVIASVAKKSQNMKKLLLVFVMLNMFQHLSIAQGEFIIEIDRTDGSFIKTGPAITDVLTVYPDDRTYDENTGTFYFTSATLTHSILSIDVSDGSIVNNPLINNIKAFQFDNSTNILYALQNDNVNNLKNFISIDPATGNYSQIGNSIPGSSMFSGGYSAYNEVNHTYVFLNPPNILYSINATNGSILSNPAWVLAQEEYIVNFTFDNSTGILYGILNDNILHQYFLCIINPATGTNTRIGPGTTFGTGNGSVAIDEANQQFIYMYSDGGFKISTFDISTGMVLYNATLPLDFPADNAHGLEYDNIQGKLYSIHWDAVIEEPDTNELSANIESSDPVCIGECIGSATVNAEHGTMPYSYSWSNSETTQTITGLCQGSYSVTVTDAADSSISVSFIINDGLNIPITITQNGDTLFATAAPNYQWYFNDTLIPEATDQSYIITESGYYYVTTTQDGCSFTANSIETGCICVGIAENKFAKSITLFPNPATTTLTLTTEQPLKNAELKIMNAIGQEVYHSSPDSYRDDVRNSTPDSYRVDISSLPSGLYYLTLQSNEGVATKKFEVIK
jgi:hypothetical protein